MIEAYPLAWPPGRPRTPSHKRVPSNFDTSFARARDQLLREIKILVRATRTPTSREVIVSTNIPVRMDGLPYALRAGRLLDPGVAVYFDYAGQARAFACDRWTAVEDNLHAICKTIDALRGIARWGTGDMMDAAFAGFTALPSPGNSRHAARPWRQVLHFQPGEMPELTAVRDRYRRFASINHPDKGGQDAYMSELNVARDAAERELGRGA
jgi:hypothetical protein